MEDIYYRSFNDPRLREAIRELPEEVMCERIDAKVQDFLSDPDKIAEADLSVLDGMSEEHYRQLETAMADLDATPPDRLIGSALLERLYMLAKPHGHARLSTLRFFAEQYVLNEIQKELDCDCDARQERST